MLPQVEDAHSKLLRPLRRHQEHLAPLIDRTTVEREGVEPIRMRPEIPTRTAPSTKPPRTRPLQNGRHSMFNGGPIVDSRRLTLSREISRQRRRAMESWSPYPPPPSSAPAR
jgi:hypothetical protein